LCLVPCLVSAYGFICVSMYDCDIAIVL